MNYTENSNTILFKDYELFLNTQESNNTSFILDENIRILAFIDPSSNNNDDISKLFDIIKACKVAPEEVHVIADASAWRNFRNRDHIKEVFVLGVPELDLELNIKFPMHYPYEFDNRTWFKTIKINELRNSAEAKSSLWNKALKPYYIK